MYQMSEDFEHSILGLFFKTPGLYKTDRNIHIIMYCGIISNRGGQF